VRAFDEIAIRRGQTLAQPCACLDLARPRVTSTLIGVSSAQQLEDNVAALQGLEFAPDQLAEIDRHAQEGAINVWAPSSET
jgi:L-glyceraldehyde 3-phosphate reductase